MVGVTTSYLTENKMNKINTKQKINIGDKNIIVLDNEQWYVEIKWVSRLGADLQIKDKIYKHSWGLSTHIHFKNILMCQMWFAEYLKHNNWNRLFGLPQRTVEHCRKKYGEDWYESRQKVFKEKARIE